jgi:hypothetical protein
MTLWFGSASARRRFVVAEDSVMVFWKFSAINSSGLFLAIVPAWLWFIRKKDRFSEKNLPQASPSAWSVCAPEFQRKP